MPPHGVCALRSTRALVPWVLLAGAVWARGTSADMRRGAFAPKDVTCKAWDSLSGNDKTYAEEKGC